MLEEGGTTYNTTAVNESSVRKIKPPRLAFALILGVTYALMVAASWISRRHGEVFAQLDMKDLPIPTELVLKIAQLLASPTGLAISALSIGIVILLALKGVLDRLLKLLIGVNVVWLAIFLLSTWVTWKTVVQIGRHLQRNP
jgi:hypothetical protein